MAEAFMIAKYRYFIPVILFVTAWISSYVIVSNRRAAVTEIINKASREHQPIVCIKSLRDGDIPEWHISTIDAQAVKLIPTSMQASFSNLFFSEDGSIRNPVSSQYPESIYRLYDYKLPDIYTRQSHQLENTVLEVDSVFTHFYITEGCNDTATLTPHGFQVDNFETAESTDFTFKSIPPSFTESDELPLRDIRIDSELSTLICIEGEWEQRCILWRYDIADGTWTALIKRENITSFGVGPDGRIIGVKFDRQGPSESIFVDGYTGQTLHTIYGMDEFVIGERWIACQEGIQYSGNQMGIIFIDMDNNWEERRLTFPCDDFSHFAMYEPPEGGVEAMLRMRENVE
jgi:hypothetical protein